ncbi:MAG: DUF2202 domain-containing protein, partial [Bdellovibrionales bacterium]|nr:DUF2202 domain-containing protein [Bdellovibrionales bacterium]
MKTKFNPRQLFGLILGNFLWKCSVGMLLVLSLFSSIAAAQVKSCVQTALPLSPEAQSDLSFMIEEEKVAGDLYGSFYLLFESKIFSNIESSERNHEGAL